MQLIYDQLIFRINEVLKPNNKREIKAEKLNALLTDVVNSRVSINYSLIRPYSIGCCCIYNGVFYVCINDTNGLFNAPDWEALIF